MKQYVLLLFVQGKIFRSVQGKMRGDLILDGLKKNGLNLTLRRRAQAAKQVGVS